MVPGFRSKKVFNADAPALSVFPVNVLLGSKPATSIDIVLPQSSIVPAVVDATVSFDITSQCGIPTFTGGTEKGPGF